MRAAALLLVALPAYAHGGEALIFPASFVFLLVPAVGVLVARWARWWARVLTALVMLGGNVALWPLTERTVTYYPGRVMATLLVLPLVAGALLGTALWLRFSRRRA